MKKEPPKTARERAYAEILATARDGLASYYRAHPERIKDSRAQGAIKASMSGVRAIFSILDKYEIEFREEVDPKVK